MKVGRSVNKKEGLRAGVRWRKGVDKDELRVDIVGDDGSILGLVEGCSLLCKEEERSKDE